MTIVSKIELLRSEALREAWNSPAMATVKALDDAVVASGGISLLSRPLNEPPGRRPEVVTAGLILNTASISTKMAKISQGDAAELALRELGPLPVGRLMEAAIDRGASITGEKPLTSFRSMLSKDDRFVSIIRSNMYFWWLSSESLPQGFDEEFSTQIEDLLERSSGASERGGGQDGPSTS